MSADLGRLEDLPADYRSALATQHVTPLWPSLRALLPPGVPRPRTQVMHWSYEALRPLLMRAGELTPIEKAERRVLVLANPGFGAESMQASAAIYLGMQLLLPGEWASSHRHTPNAVRMIVEGEGAYTTVQGERCPMSRGDLVLTPTGLWHEHGHDGDEPVVWLDVLDLPLVHYVEASYHVDGARQAITRQGGDYASPGIVPTLGVFSRSDQNYPMLRYPWVATRAALEALAARRPATEPLIVRYVNPETGADTQAILGYSALMLRPGEALSLPARSPAAAYHVIQGAAELSIGDQRFALAEADTSLVPGYMPARLVNPSPSHPAFLFIADETPLHQKLGVYEERA